MSRISGLRPVLILLWSFQFLFKGRFPVQSLVSCLFGSSICPNILTLFTKCIVLVYVRTKSFLTPPGRRSGTLSELAKQGPSDLGPLRNGTPPYLQKTGPLRIGISTNRQKTVPLRNDPPPRIGKICPFRVGTPAHSQNMTLPMC